MSITRIPAALRRRVEGRAHRHYEYCLLPAEVTLFPHEVDHVVAEKHGGATDEANLAFTCWRRDRHKGSDLGSFDPDTGAFSLLYNPRTQRWGEHFVAHGGIMGGLTSEGRTTVRLLQLNTDERTRERQRLAASGRYPPRDDEAPR